ncbi:hypothetical protein [Maribacter sp. 2307ULW6-5]|uniref:hypothetical protein n=1 Tax=Maribacter sp. 2307ULW6-5 TaxID=3386275 RepID=UPI0039BCBC19
MPGCTTFGDAPIVDTITDIVGTIVPGNEGCGAFLLRPDERVRNTVLLDFFPCNLDPAFQVPNAQVVFSGHIYQGINDGDQCANFFEVTAIRFMEE